MKMTRKLNQTAVYWANPTVSGDGTHTFDDPVEVICRWEEKNELFMSGQGVQKFSTAVVFINQDMKVGEYLMLGTIDDLSTSSSATPYEEESYKIERFSKMPDISGTTFVRKVWL